MDSTRGPFTGTPGLYGGMPGHSDGDLDLNPADPTITLEFLEEEGDTVDQEISCRDYGKAGLLIGTRRPYNLNFPTFHRDLLEGLYPRGYEQVGEDTGEPGRGEEDAGLVDPGIPFKDLKEVKQLNPALGWLSNWVPPFIRTPQSLDLQETEILARLNDYKESLIQVKKDLDLRRKTLRENANNLSVQIRQAKTQMEVAKQVLQGCKTRRDDIEVAGQHLKSIGEAEKHLEIKVTFLTNLQGQRRELLADYRRLRKEWHIVQAHLSELREGLEQTFLEQRSGTLTILHNLEQYLAKMFDDMNFELSGLPSGKFTRLSGRINRLHERSKAGETNTKKELTECLSKILKLEQLNLKKGEEEKYPLLGEQIKKLKEDARNSKLVQEIQPAFAHKFLSTLKNTFKKGCLAAYNEEGLTTPLEKELSLMEFLKESAGEIVFMQHFIKTQDLSLTEAITSIHQYLNRNDLPIKMIHCVCCYLRFPDLMELFNLQHFFSPKEIEELEGIDLTGTGKHKVKVDEGEPKSLVSTDGQAFLSVTTPYLKLLILIDQSTDGKLIPVETIEKYNKILKENLDFLLSKAPFDHLKEAISLLLELFKISYIELIYDMQSEDDIAPIHFNFLLEINTPHQCPHILLNAGGCRTFAVSGEKIYPLEHEQMEKKEVPEKPFYPKIHIDYFKGLLPDEYYLTISQNCLKVLELCFERDSLEDIEELIGEEILDKDDPVTKQKYVESLLADELTKQLKAGKTDIQEICKAMSEKFRTIPDIAPTLKGEVKRSWEVIKEEDLTPYLNSILVVGFSNAPEAPPETEI